MKLGLKFPERLAGALYPVREALEDLIIGIEKGWAQEHLGTGQHNAITAQSIGNPVPSETAVLAVTSGLQVQQGPMSLSQGFTGNTADQAILTPPQITANVNDYSPAGLDQGLVLRLNVDANRTVTGLRRPQPTQARMYWLINTTTSIITLAHESTSSVAGNRFYCPGATDYFLHGYAAIATLYDPVTLRWRVVESSIPSVYYTAGNVGIGTTAPSVYGSGGIGRNLEIRSLGASSSPNVTFSVDQVAVNVNCGSFTWATTGTAGTEKRVAYVQTSLDSDSTTTTNGRIELHTSNAGVVTERMRIDKNGNVGIGMVPGAQLDLSTDSARKLTTTTWATGSDSRIKTDIRRIEDGLSVIRQMRAVKYRYNADFLAAHPSVKDVDYYNFIAQEYQQVFPTSVTETDGLLYLNTANMIPYAIAGIQELDLALLNHEQQVTVLKATIDQRIRTIEDQLSLLTTRTLPSPNGNVAGFVG